MEYAAFFRGLNVGGKGVVKMAGLKAMLAELELENVQTYIQSGNAVFGSSDKPKKLKRKIETAFTDKFGFESSVILRSKDEIAAIVEESPFPAKLVEEAIAANSKIEHVYVYFLDSIPPNEAICTLQAGYEGRDRLLHKGREIYLLCYDSVRISAPAAALAKLNIPMTSRNWKTLYKVHTMMGG